MIDSQVVGGDGSFMREYIGRAYDAGQKFAQSIVGGYISPVSGSRRDLLVAHRCWKKVTRITRFWAVNVGVGCFVRTTVGSADGLCRTLENDPRRGIERSSMLVEMGW